MPLQYAWIVQDCDDEQAQEMQDAGFIVSSNEDFAALTATQDDWFYNNCPQNVPPMITMRQARQALVLNNINLDNVEAAINNLPAPHNQLALIEWQYSSAVLRSNPLVLMIAGSMGWSSVDVDHLFLQAGLL